MAPPSPAIGADAARSAGPGVAGLVMVRVALRAGVTPLVLFLGLALSGCQPQEHAVTVRIEETGEIHALPDTAR